MSARNVCKQVVVDFDEVVDLNIDGFNTYLCELTDEPCLQDISWEVVGTSAGGIVLEVSGWVEEVSDGN